MKREWLIASVCLLAGCKQVSAFFFGDPDNLPTNEIAEASTATIAPTVTSAKTPPKVAPIRFKDGAFASSEYMEASALRDRGQLWTAHLVLAPKALGDSARREETDLLLEICESQQDKECITNCKAKLSGKNLARDVEKLAAQMAAADYKGVRKTLLPKAKNGTLSEDEGRMLSAACTALKDKSCVQTVKE